MGKYLVMIYDNEAKWAEARVPAEEANHLRHEAFAQANGAALRGGAQLGESNTATSIRSDGNGGVVVTDGDVRGDQGSDRRLLRHRGGGSGRGAGDRQSGPGPDGRRTRKRWPSPTTPLRPRT